MKTYKEIKANLKSDVSSLPTIKVALLGDSATQFLATAIKGLGVDCGFNINLFEAQFNQIEIQIENPASELHKFQPKYIVLFQSTHKLCVEHAKMSVDAQANLAENRLDSVERICEAYESSKIICLNYPEIGDGVFGSYCNSVESSFTYQVRKLNYELMRLTAKRHNLYVCDIAEVQNKYGRNFMFSPNVYVCTEMVLSLDAVPLVASRIVDIISASEGKAKKCLILDLDNTLWGGIIGDDGMAGIQLGHGLGIGKAFCELQLWVKKLKGRGIIICICSKNDEEVAKEPFRTHPDMVLHLDDIAVFMANWENKVDNIHAIQKILNISYDSMVFLDDNPFERGIIRENIPEICVPELPKDPADYLEYLYSLNLFETVSFSSLDSERTHQYQVQSQRHKFSKTFANESDFLKSLGMTSCVEGLTKFNIPRVAQLTQRSNQFNLRTVRYSQSDIERMVNDSDVVCVNFSLSDKFGDNGLICTVILKRVDENAAFIDTWVMSCRVLNRGMENFTLNTIVDIARKNGFSEIIGEYIRSPKNKMVEDHYLSLGFSEMEGEEHDNRRYVLHIDKYCNKECYIKKQVTK